MLKIARFPLGFFIFAHGIAHFLATSVYWKLNTAKDLPYTTQILAGQLDLGSVGIWLFGLVWLLVGSGTAAVGAALLVTSRWSKPMLLVATLFSLIICALVYDRAQVGLVIDVAILLALAVTTVLPSRATTIAQAH